MKRYSQRKKRSSLKKYVFVGLFFLLIITSGYFLVWSPYLWINDINVQGEAKYYSDSDIKEIAWTKIEFPYKSIVLVPLNQIKQEILERYPEIKQVEINRHLPNSLVIKIEERKNTGVWCQKQVNQCFFFDSEGIIFQPAPLIKGSLIINVYGVEDSIKVRDQILSSEMIEFILAIKKGLPEISLPEAVDFEVVSLEDLRVTTARGWQIYFNPKYSVESQLETLKRIFNKEIDLNQALEYIDLRIQGRVYYK